MMEHQPHPGPSLPPYGRLAPLPCGHAPIDGCNCPRMTVREALSISAAVAVECDALYEALVRACANAGYAVQNPGSFHGGLSNARSSAPNGTTSWGRSAVDDQLFSDEAATCAECADAEFTIDPASELISDPGKFEGEPLFTFHAYHAMLDGFTDDDAGCAWRVGNVICEESDTGFVYGRAFDSDEEAAAHFAIAYNDEEGDDEDE